MQAQGFPVGAQRFGAQWLPRNAPMQQAPQGGLSCGVGSIGPQPSVARTSEFQGPNLGQTVVPPGGMTPQQLRFQE